MSGLNKAIGGYFELELPESKGHLYPKAIKYQSARAAFYALLQHAKPKKVWVPKFICDSIITPLEATKTEVMFYALNDDFSIKNNIKLNDGEWLFYVNYFGLCSGQQYKILSQYNPEQVIFDHSQAFFDKPLNALATIYSPRKFFGVADGGLLITKLDITEPEEIDMESVLRSEHLLKRLDSTPESGYADFIKAEKSLMDLTPKKMSALTDRILTSIDYLKVQKRRKENFIFLHKNLKHRNILASIIDLDNINGAMIYPFLPNQMGLKKKLIDSRIFIPTYWPDCEKRIDTDSVEKKLLDFLIPIPCDHRYDQVELNSILTEIFK